MKTLLLIKEKEFHWFRSVSPDQCPLLAPVCNKPLLEYLVEFAVTCGSRKIRLATDAPLDDVKPVFGDGGRWGVELTYASVEETDRLEDTLKKNSAYCKGSRLLVMEGCFFLHYDKNEDYTRFMQTAQPGVLLTCNTGSIIIQGTAPETDPLPVTSAQFLAMTPIRSAGDLHRLSMRVLTRYSRRYSLPGYNPEAGIFIGRNVMFAKTARINPPVMIGDHSHILKAAEIGPEAVIGRDVIIDMHSRVQGSIILDNTYVGEHLELNQKIVCGQILLDPSRGTAVSMKDNLLLAKVIGK